MSSSDSFPFALQTLLTSSLNLSTLLLDFLPLCQQLRKFFSYTSFLTTVSVMHMLAFGIFSPLVLSLFIPHPARNRPHCPPSLPLLSGRWALSYCYNPSPPSLPFIFSAVPIQNFKNVFKAQILSLLNLPSSVDFIACFTKELKITWFSPLLYISISVFTDPLLQCQGKKYSSPSLRLIPLLMFLISSHLICPCYVCYFLFVLNLK